jgi:hypothetical protein
MKTAGCAMEMREFFKLAGGALILIPAGLFLVRCGGSGSDQSGGGQTIQPTLNGTKLIYSSSGVEGHWHTFGIEMSAIDRPPANGVSGPSSVTEDHSHNVIVSAAELSSISAGETVEVASGTADGHTHLFIFFKLA